MVNDSATRGSHGLRDLKVRIPARHHAALQSAKLLTGRRIRDVVRDALDAYLDERA